MKKTPNFALRLVIGWMAAIFLVCILLSGCTAVQKANTVAQTVCDSLYPKKTVCITDTIYLPGPTDTIYVPEPAYATDTFFMDRYMVVDSRRATLLIQKLQDSLERQEGIIRRQVRTISAFKRYSYRRQKAISDNARF